MLDVIYKRPHKRKLDFDRVTIKDDLGISIMKGLLIVLRRRMIKAFLFELNRHFLGSIRCTDVRHLDEISGEFCKL